MESPGSLAVDARKLPVGAKLQIKGLQVKHYLSNSSRSQSVEYWDIDAHHCPTFHHVLILTMASAEDRDLH